MQTSQSWARALRSAGLLRPQPDTKKCEQRAPFSRSLGEEEGRVIEPRKTANNNRKTHPSIFQKSWGRGSHESRPPHGTHPKHRTSGGGPGAGPWIHLPLERSLASALALGQHPWTRSAGSATRGDSVGTFAPGAQHVGKRAEQVRWRRFFAAPRSMRLLPDLEDLVIKTTVASRLYLTGTH